MDRIKKVCYEKFELEKKSYEWIELFKRLRNKGFIEISKNEVRIEEAYLEFVIEDSLSMLDNLIEMKDIFSNDFEALIEVGNQAGKIGIIDIQKAKYLWVAIEAYEEALKVRTLEDLPMDYAMTQNNLGIAYRNLADVEDKAENCRKAIEAFEAALKVRTLEDLPMQYATTQNNLGNAYRNLADVEDKAENCRKAIEAYEAALKVRTLEDLPMQYAMTQNNLGIAYRNLADVEDKAENCKRAIEAYGETLNVFSKEKHPEIYKRVASNLLRALAFCEDEEVLVKP